MLKVGKVSYLNTLPIFYRWDTSKISVVEGHPSELVNKLRENEIQAGIVSSIEFLLHPEEYRVVPGVCISSKEKACSVLILSKKPMKSISSLYLTPASMTSKVLAKYVAKRVYKNNPKIVEDRSSADALMLIGDEAIRERVSDKWQYVYDLGEEWFKLHKLPFVFALFLVRSDAPHWLDNFIAESSKVSREEFYRDLRKGTVKLEGYDYQTLRDYFTLCLNYELDQRGWQSLKIFKEILIEESILCK